MGFKSSPSCLYHPSNHICCQIVLVQKKTDGPDSRTHLGEHDTMAPHKNTSSTAVFQNPDSEILILVMDSQRSIYIRIYKQNKFKQIFLGNIYCAEVYGIYYERIIASEQW